MYRPLFEMIEDASKQELKKLIKNTKNRMAKLKREMNKKDYNKKPKKCPDNQTVYDCEKYFLELAVSRLNGLE